MKNTITIIAIAALAGSATAGISSATNTGTVTYDVDTGGANVGNDYYGSGNDDAFGEYGVTTFNFTAADFGFAAVDNVLEANLALTVNDRAFADGTAVEFFFTTDDSVAGLAYNNLFDNGIDASQFGYGPVSLGVFSIAEMAGRPGGEIDTFGLNFAGSVLADLLAEINAGSDFQIIIAATNAADDLTYSGVGNTFDPGDPALTIRATPAPGAAALLGLGGLVAARRRR